jgi:hypothetical protein
MIRCFYHKAETVILFKKKHKLRVFENRVPKKILGAEDIVTGDWRKFRSEKLQSLYSTPNIIGMKKSSRMRLVRHAALTENKEYEEGIVGKT